MDLFLYLHRDDIGAIQEDVIKKTLLDNEMYLIISWLSGKCPISFVEWYREEVCEWKLKHLEVGAISSSRQEDISLQLDLLWGPMVHLPLTTPARRNIFAQEKILDTPHTQEWFWSDCLTFRNTRGAHQASSGCAFQAYWKPRTQSPWDHCPSWCISGSVRLNAQQMLQVPHSVSSSHLHQMFCAHSVWSSLQMRSLITFKVNSSFHIPVFKFALDLHFSSKEGDLEGLLDPCLLNSVNSPGWFFYFIGRPE